MYKYGVYDVHDNSHEYFNTLEEAQEWVDGIDIDNRDNEHCPEGDFAVIYKLVEVENYQYDEEGYTVGKMLGSEGKVNDQ